MSADQHISPDHLSAEVIGRYRSRKLDQRELILAWRHLAACEECRRLAVRGQEVSRLLGALGPEHLSFEQLENLVGNPAHAANGECLEHVTFCSICAAELADLKAFRTTLGLSARRRPHQTALRFLIPAAAVTIVLLTFAGLEFVRHPAGVPAVEQSAVVASVKNAGGLAGVDLAALDASDRQAITEALRDGKLPAQADIRDLMRNRETLLSGGTTRPVLTVVGPTGTAVSTDRPLFRWQAPAGSGSFRVAIFDSDFNPVAASGPVDGTEWKPEEPLARAKTYIWTVSGTVGGVKVTAPQAPEPEARFRVAGQTQAEALQKLAEKSELAYFLAAWRAGMREEAGAAMNRLLEKNPGSKELERLAAAMGAKP